ncbi:MAG TPA: hypothetical protein VNH41_05125 [Steroidobacteraceae bacterium]|nr:hypothetical protein [Steroidobacteraceae bacterium]
MALAPSVNQVAPPLARAFAYDENAYAQPHVTVQTINGSSSGTNGLTLLAAALPGGVSGKQLRSITVIPLSAPTGVDYLNLTLQSYAAQVFGTATATAVSLGNGTNLGTGINKVQFCILTAAVNGTATGSYVGPTGTQFVGIGTQVAYNPTFIPLVGGTCTVIVTAPAGTNTQGGYVFPSGPNGGLTIGPNDVLVLTKGTDTIASYTVEFEWTYTPGGSFSK